MDVSAGKWVSLLNTLSLELSERDPVELAALKKLAFSLCALRVLEKYRLSPGPSLCTLVNSNAPAPLTVGIHSALGEVNQAFHTSLFSFPEDTPCRELSLKQLAEEIVHCPEDLDLEVLSALYERFLCSSGHKKEGIFYTPPEVVRRMVHETLGPIVAQAGATRLRALRILDPACGSGVFLLEAARYLAAVLGTRSIDAKAALFKTSLFGVDKDETAVLLARFLLAVELARSRQLSLFKAEIPDFSSQIKYGNALLEPADFDPLDPAQHRQMDELKAFGFSQAFPEVMARGGFDCIVGNPPYGLSRDEQLSSEENEKLKVVYRSYRHGKLNKYLLFMARGYQLLAPSGALSYIVPNAWLGIRAGSAIRRLWLKDQSLRSVSILDYPVFAEPGVEAVIFTVDRSRRWTRVKMRRYAKPNQRRAVENFNVPVSVCLNSADCQIPTRSSTEIRGILKKIDHRHLTLGSPGSPFVPLIALQAYAVGKGTPPQTREDVKQHVFHRPAKEDSSCIPYLEGGDIGRFHAQPSGEFLRYGPWLAEPQQLGRFSGPRIVIREVISEWPHVLIAAYLEEPMLYNKSVLHILPKEGIGKDYLLALLAILNSRFASFIIQARGRKSQRRLFPKIVNADLKDFPLPAQLLQHLNILAECARTMMTFAGEGAEQEGLEGCQRKIDQTVMDAYGLTAEDMRVIEEHHEALYH